MPTRRPPSPLTALAALLLMGLASGACQSSPSKPVAPTDPQAQEPAASDAASAAAGSSRALAPMPPGAQAATFAGGCFWCMERPFEILEGVYSVTSGYAGGPEREPTYEQVASGQTGHAEVVQVVYDPNLITYEVLLDTFWRQIDPTQVDGQFVDRGRQYRTAIFTHDERQRELALASRQALADSKRFDKPIVTAIEPLTQFWPAEEYHQDFYKKNPARYKSYRSGSGRDAFLRVKWPELYSP